MYRLRYRKDRLGSVAKKSEFGGEIYHSKMEAGEAFNLDMRKRAGELTDVKRQVRISLDVNGYHICNYIIDFVVTHKDGTLEYIEVKGFATDMWRMKWKLFEALYSGKPGVKLTVVR